MSTSVKYKVTYDGCGQASLLGRDQTLAFIESHLMSPFIHLDGKFRHSRLSDFVIEEATTTLRRVNLKQKLEIV